MLLDPIYEGQTWRCVHVGASPVVVCLKTRTALEPTLMKMAVTSSPFKLFGAIPVTYHVPALSRIFRRKVLRATPSLSKHGKPVNVDGPTIPSETALSIRRVSGIKSIDAYF
jgi:hypothetical protein